MSAQNFCSLASEVTSPTLDQSRRLQGLPTFKGRGHNEGASVGRRKPLFQNLGEIFPPGRRERTSAESQDGDKLLESGNRSVCLEGSGGRGSEWR